MEITTKHWVIGGIVLAVIALFAFIFFTNPSSPAPAAVDISKITTAGHAFIGQDNAPVTIAYWSDYQCTFCKQFEEDVVSRLVANYVTTGKVKIVFKDFAFIGPDSQTAAIAGRAVWQVAPDKFYQWHAAMFAAQAAENSGWATKDKILALTKTLGIDADKVGQLMADNANDYQSAVTADQNEGVAIGINGTPSVVIGNQLLYGLTSYDTVKSLVDAQLNKKP